jgi:hypothetical protein
LRPLLFYLIAGLLHEGEEGGKVGGLFFKSSVNGGAQLLLEGKRPFPALGPFPPFRLLARLARSNKKPPASASGPSLLYFVLSFVVILRQIRKQNPKIIPSAVENTVNVHILPIHMVENHIISTDEKSVVAFYICHRGQRSADF